MTNVTPLQQPPVEDLRNALTIAELWKDEVLRLPAGEHSQALYDIARLIRHALDQLGKPNEAAIQAAKLFVDAAGPEHWERQARDCAAAVISKQLRGVSP